MTLGGPQQLPDASAAEPEGATISAGQKPDPEAAAQAEAAETGRPAEVLSQRTETTQVFANADGTFTQDTYALPKFVRQDGKLVSIDTTLKSRPDGSLSPKATEVDVRLSGGGEGPLATVVRDGRSMSWTWPDALPEPEVDGDTVTYGNVLTDVDLKVKANPAGFTSLLVVKTPEAAADPALRQVHFGLETDGLKASTDAHGNFTAVNPAGETVFTAPSPMMWDSSTAAAPAAALSARSAPTGPPPPADEFEPGYGAQQANMGLAVTDGKLRLTPDQDLLTGKDTQYPVLLDPAVSGSRHSWTIAYKRNPNSSYFNGANWNGVKGTTTARVGYENETNGLARSYFRMNSSNLWSTKKIVSSSTFRIKNTWSWSCTNKPVELWATSAISASTTWNNRPERRKKLDTVNESLGWGSNCPAGDLAFDVTAAAKDGIANKWNTLTFGMQAPDSDENNVFGWKKFDANSARLSTVYNTVPNLPNSLDTIPSSGGCDMVAPYTTIGNTDVTLTAKVSDPDGGTVRAQFRLWGTNDLAGGAEIFNQIVSATSGTVAKVKVPKTTLQKYLTAAKGNFGWKVQALDASAHSSWNPNPGTCRFNFDPTRPSTPPTISSQQFPDGSDGWPSTTGQARTAGTFILGNGGVADVTSYEYWSDWDPTVRKVTPGTDLDGDGSIDAKLVLTPPAAGSQRLHVRSLDAAQNRSDQASYFFYANGLSVPDKAGDLNGDGNADLYGVRGSGELWLYPGQGNGYIGAGTMAGNGDFSQADITHRGDWTGDGFEDLIAAIPGDGGKSLHLYPNNGAGWACTALDEQADGHSRSCQYDRQELDVFDPANNHWKNADQILAIGDVDGPLDTDNDGTVDVAGYPDLLVKEGNLIWLYFGSEFFFLDADRAPVLIGNESWSNYDLVAPGDRTGNGRVDLIARHKTNGELRLYQGTGPAGEGLGDGAASAAIGTGWTRAYRPLVTAFPDASSDGKADIFATGGDDKLYLYPNLSGSGVAVGTSGWLDFQALS
ncbi:VCBS repeat-containing protein [Streptomyces sp. MMBL 11-1]|uniref:VCBS repeat-containing protein n=1 Tax=Streptomyces sp. MMBL 11-1 TaxID=3026420 RepID=UPI00235E0BFE|nr:VCBS repeat-containing protein [Streptomyces sp. MMBL 11-1]